MSRDSMTAVRRAPSHSKENGHIAPIPAPLCANLPHPSAGNTPDDTPVSATSELTHTWVHFAKTFVLIFPIYALGYFEFSFSWLLIGLVVFFWWRRNTGGKYSRLSRALAFFEQEERSVKQSLTTSDLPSWVHFPDVERVEWLNKTVKQMWPYICKFVEKLFRETIEPAVKESNAHLSTFCFSKIDIGDKPLRVNGVKVYTENVDKRQIIMDLQISFVGNTEIDVDIKRYYCKAGIKSIQIHGVLRVVMEPLLGDMPLVGALSLFFLKKPLLDINWTGLTNILDIPGLNGFSDSLIQDIIYSYLVLPNRITVPLVGDVELAQLRFPMPKGVLRIHFLEAQDLEGKDKFLGGLIKGKSDPYGILQIGNQLFQSKTIKESLHPKWNEVYEALVYEHSGQHLEIELFDEDPDKDDFLGSLMIDMTELHKEQKVDEWFDLEEAPTGKLHLKLEWLSLLSTPTKLDQVLRSVRADRSLANDGLSSALLVVYLDSAKNLPSNLSDFTYDGLKQVSVFKALKSAKKSSSEPSPYVQLTVGHKSLESKIRYKTKEPMWEDCFSFLVHNPRRQELEVEVKDDKRKCTLGNLTVPLSGLLAEEDMTLTQCFPLKNSGPSSTIKLKMALRILLLEKQGSSDQPSTVRVRKSSVPQPTTTTPSLRQSISESPLPSFTPPPPIDASTLTLQHRDGEPYSASPLRSTSSLSTCISSSQKHLPHKESTPSLASDISLPFATLELQQRLRQLQNGSAPSQYPLGEIQLTVRHSSQRNKLIVVVHACRNLIAFTKDGSDPFIRLYLLPDKSRTGRRKTGTMKRTLNPVYDQTFEFSVSMVELHRRTLDVAVKNGGSILSKHKGLLGKVLVDLSGDDISKGWTQWYDLSEDGLSSQCMRSIQDPLLT
ncbi:extended synaptotagmin-2 isoform X1 [Thunnus maccoyii]|uniref:extended synaptotagmin-2 isoform X1 n=2 Tax=Thunnus maccoyii TaxID=8240 RepID=UPI001C4C92C3|nr:extended synaptotagmin-2 isoform X1 [Thunnus maccoyii]